MTYNPFKNSARHAFGRVRVNTGLFERFKGPGGLHNIGNVLALIGGFLVYYLSSPSIENTVRIVSRYLFEDFGSACLTIAMILFLLGGEAYHRAWQTSEKPTQSLIRMGDFLSGIAAFIMTFALVRFGNTQLALLAGGMLTIGKLGAAVFPEFAQPPKLNPMYLFRWMAIVSRFPSLAALIVTLWSFFMLGTDGSDAAIAAVMFLSYLLWLWGDCLLLRGAKGCVVTV